MKMTIDFDKAKKLLEDKPFISKEEYNRRFWDLWEKKKENIKQEENNNG
jgi:hypothetical protein